MLMFVLCAGVLREGAAIAQSQSHQPDPVLERLERGKLIERQIHTDGVHTYGLELKTVKTELMPWVREHYQVTHDPARSVVGGLSLGGLAAAYSCQTDSETSGRCDAPVRRAVVGTERRPG